MITVDQIIRDIVRREGGFSNRAADKGGPTNFGITAKTLGEWRRLGRTATVAEVQGMTESEACDIYRERYVAPFEWIREPLRTLMIDWAVTSWHDDPSVALQVVLRRRGLYAGGIDGLLGPLSRAGVMGDPDPAETYRLMVESRIRFYLGLALDDADVRLFMIKHPASQLHNVRGWINRALEFLA